ncbi:MAG: carboxypeptidase-like regulatory domain-containing protein [Candidatus Dadabacteria bacterium]
MKLPHFLFLFCLTAINIYSFAQGTITGQVVDGETKEPLAGASVFAQNTTKGTITDKDGKFSLWLSKGGYEIIISYTGYTSRSINLADLTSDREFNIELQKGDNALSEVIIKNSNEVPDGWEKYGDFFLKSFIGSTPYAQHCTLLNPEVLKFLYFKRTNKLKILATEPLQIQNNSLGYNLRYQLDSFVYLNNEEVNSYRGYCLYTAMDGNPEQQRLWSENRRKVYYGSRLHFLRSYFDSSLKQEGFTVDIVSASGPNRFARLVNPYDKEYYLFNDTASTAELWFPAKVSITYNNKAPEKEYLQQYNLPSDVPVQISYVDIPEAIIIKQNGYFTDQNSWINQGYWSWKNVADQLPYDYEPQ